MQDYNKIVKLGVWAIEYWKQKESLDIYPVYISY